METETKKRAYNKDPREKNKRGTWIIPFTPDKEAGELLIKNNDETGAPYNRIINNAIKSTLGKVKAKK